MKTVVFFFRRVGGYVCALSALLWAMPGYAQTGGIQGKVSDENQQPLVGASVHIVELNRQAGTNEQGNYSFTGVPDGTYTLTVSYIGYEQAERAVTVAESVQTVDFSLLSSGESLDEVVVIGYGTARKRDLTGSVASVQAKDFNKGPFMILPFCWTTNFKPNILFSFFRIALPDIFSFSNPLPKGIEGV